MEVAPRYKLLTLFTLYVYTAYILTLIPHRTLLTLLKMLKQVWSKMALMPNCLYMIWQYCFVGFCAKGGSG